MSLWFRVWSTPNNSDIRFEKADTYDVDGYVIARNVDTSAIFLVGQLIGSNLGNISYADGVSVTDTGSFNAKWTQLTMTSPPTSVVWTLAIAADWQSFIQSFSNEQDFLYIMKGSKVVFLNTEQFNYYSIDDQLIVTEYGWDFFAEYYIDNVTYCRQWNLLSSSTESFTIWEAINNSFYLHTSDGSMLTLGTVEFPYDDLPNIPAIASGGSVVLSLQQYLPNDSSLLSHDCLFARVSITGDPNESQSITTRHVYGKPDATWPTNFNGMSSNIPTVGMQFVSLCLRAKTAFLEKFPKYKKMCCAGPMEPNLQLLLCDQFTVDGGPGNNANCNDFMSTWCESGGTGTRENAPECACYGPIADDIDNDIYTAMDGSRPRRCVVGACQRGYIPSDSLDHQCTPLCVQVAKLTADCDGMIKYNVQQLMDCGN